MFKSKTVFVVGAGASVEFGLPLGAELTSKIGGLLKIAYKGGLDLSSGDPKIAEAYDILARRTTGLTAESLRTNGQKVVDAMPLAVSIDNFLEAHSSNDQIEICAKLGIARAILLAESQSALARINQINVSRTFAVEQLKKSWIAALVHRLVEGMNRPKLGELFDNVVFVVFNYDRCLEHFLFNALPIYYDVPRETIAGILNKATFLHPYGSIGLLPWQSGSGPSVAFGADIGATSLIEVARQIRVFSEQVDSPEFIGRMKETIGSATTFAFLGFSYLDQNMQLLRTASSDLRTRVYGTALGISKADQEVVRESLSRTLGVQRERIHLVEKKCPELFSEYSRSITS